MVNSAIQGFTMDKIVSNAEAKMAELEKKTRVKIHMGTCGISSGAEDVLDAFTKEIALRKLADTIILKAGCIGLCGIEPVVTVIVPGKDRVIYKELTPEKVRRIVSEHLIKGKPVTEYSLPLDTPLLKNQEIRIMHNQDLDPMDIDQYIARGGYQALSKALSAMTPQAVFEEVRKSGLRGRGGAGFPTATKWGFVHDMVSDVKYVVCNADEGDPGAYMNRAVLEGNPHSILEGMAIGAYAIGNVTKGYIYVRAEYPLAIQTLRHAIAQAHEYGFLGKNIMGTDFEFEVELFLGAGAFVCGEETALLHSIEGKRGNPRQRPPFPANVGGGLFGKPTTINNVETWSNIPQIIYRGSDWFASVGTEKSKGTKTLCLVGNVNNTGLVEVELGTTLGELIYDIGGGINQGKTFKAVQLGGPSGGVIPINCLNTPIDYESVTALGAIMGSGGVVVMDEDSCMVDVTKFFLEFTRDESCGKCIPCREGIPQMLTILDKISNGEATMEDLNFLEDLTETIASASLCGLGQTSVNPVLSTLRHFREEYEAHIIDKKCPAAVCRGMMKSPCQHTCPVELNISGYVSLIKDGRFVDAYKLIKQRNPLPGVCGRVCHHPCEHKCNRAQIDQPVAIRELKRFATEYAYSQGVRYVPPIKAKRKEKVAIIGAGPTGLSAAWDLTMEGFQVTIFEALPVAGGMLAFAIPEYRLPKALLDKEIDDIKALGVEIKLNSKIDDVDELFGRGYQAVLIAAGAQKGIRSNSEGENLNGVYDSINFLRAFSLGENPQIGRKVVVIGAGNSAIDSARIALRMGAKEVTLLYRREKKDMPALADEVDEAIKEGIKMRFLTLPTAILGVKGKVNGVRCVNIELKGFGPDGRKMPHLVEGSEFVVEADTVIEALGQQADSEFASKSGIATGKNGIILVDRRTLETNKQGVFAGGDVVTNPQTVIDAIAAGQRAASSIRRYLLGQELGPRVYREGDEPMDISTLPPTDEELKEHDRVSITQLPVEERINSFKEVVTTYTTREAREEASRCLRCDLET